jgi:hypothetical protein
MKYGLLVYNYPKQCLTVNIGDYIQSLAAKQFIPDNEDIIYVDRESLSDYGGEYVKVILNGWFMHNPQKWPPSSKIQPLFVSFHINENENVKDKLLDDLSIKYLKRYTPIGCRDTNTLNLLREKGIDAYFSACLTLTLNYKYSVKNPVRQEVIFTEFDPTFYSIKRLLKKTPSLLYYLFRQYKLLKQIAWSFHHRITIKNLMCASYFLSIYLKIFDLSILKEATYIDHYVSISQFTNEEERFNLTKQLLFKYANAKLIVTSKIHCALPTLSFDTPLIYIEDKEDSPSNLCRKTGILELFENVYYFQKGKLNKSSKSVQKEKIQTYVQNMITICEDFINNNF